MAEFSKKDLKKKSDNISDWYNDVVLKAELADYGPARGTMVIRPYGYAIWERVQSVLDANFKKNGVENSYFPLFIPLSLLTKEKEHIAGFSPELAVVTMGGGEQLSEPLVVRPTSETIMYDMYAKWIQSWRDLPMVLNQWNNVVRWEKRTYLFLRTLEFLWQEGHGAHATHEESRKLVMDAIEWYREVYEDYFAIPVIIGKKSESEKFAGASATFTLESLMPDGKVLQSCTSHDLGQNFSKAQNIVFQDKDGKNEYVWQNSWGFSTRALGALFLVHGDDQGLVMPPKIAPIQVVIVPIHKEEAQSEALNRYVDDISKELQDNNVRVKIDTRDGVSPGRKFNDWEVKGVPVRFEIGLKEYDNKTITVARRDTHEKFEIDNAHLISETQKLLETIQKSLLDRAKVFLSANTFEVSDFDEFKKVMETTRGFLRAFWCGDVACESSIKEQTKASTRCLALNEKEESGHCVYCGKPAVAKWYFAQAY